MLPAYSVFARFQRNNETADTEVADLMQALDCFTEWSHDIGAGTRISFTDPALQKAHWIKMQDFGKKHGPLGRIRRFFSKEVVSPESDLMELLDSANAIKSRHLDEFSDSEAFSVAAIEMLDRDSNEIFAHGRLASHYLSVSRWDGNWSSYRAHLTLYRYDDHILTIVVTLSSIEAFDDVHLREIGNTAMDKLEGRGRFSRLS